MSLCLTCSKKKPLKDRTTSVASWLRNAGRDNALPHYNLPSTKKGAFSPSNATVSIQMRISKPSKHKRKILYWAAKPKAISDKKWDEACYAMLDYYDRCYDYELLRAEEREKIDISGLNPQLAAEKLISEGLVD